MTKNSFIFNSNAASISSTSQNSPQMQKNISPLDTTDHFQLQLLQEVLLGMALVLQVWSA